jgi:hypothetical protein
LIIASFPAEVLRNMHKVILSQAGALTPKLGLDEVEGTISLSYLGLNNVIAKQDGRPEPLKG